MKKLYLKLLIILIPVMAYFIIFVAFDVNDFLGLRHSLFNNIEETKLIAYDGTKAVDSPYSIIRYINNIDKNNNVRYSFIFGDSRINGIDIIKLNKLDGKKYINLAFGGCTMKESIDEFWLAVSKTQPERVIFEVDYYSLNEKRQLDRIKQVIGMDAFQYFFDYFNNKSMIDEAISKIKQFNTENTARSVEPSPARFENYLGQIKAICDSYEIDEECVDGLLKIADYCKENNIDLVFFAPPVHKSIYDGVIVFYGIDKKIEKVKEKLSDKAKVLDMQYLSEISSEDRLWSDGHHFMGELMEQVEKNVTLKEKKYVKIIGKGE